jgi:N-methylhydantoinase A
MQQVFAELGERARAAMRQEGIADDDMRLERTVDARYRGQSYELSVSADNWVNDFHTAHLKRYGYAIQRRWLRR